MGLFKTIYTHQRQSVRVVRGRKGPGTKNITFEGIEELRANLESIGYDVSRIRPSFVAIDYRIGPHAHLLEFGARGGAMPAQPFFRKTIDIHSKEAFEIVGNALTEIFENKRTEDPERAILRGAEHLRAYVRAAAPMAKKGHWRKGKWLAPGGLKLSIVAKMFGTGITPRTFA